MWLIYCKHRVLDKSPRLTVYIFVKVYNKYASLFKHKSYHVFLVYIMYIVYIALTLKTIKMIVTITGQTEMVSDVIKYDSGFEKRLLRIKTIEDYPQFYQVEFTKDKMSLLDKIKVGQIKKVTANLRGNEFEPQEKGKEKQYFLNLTGWKVEDF